MRTGELIQIAAGLCARAGLAAPTGLDQLAGGNNNRVYLVRLAGSKRAILKLYHHDPRDTRDRLGAEWSFLNYAWERRVRNIPKPLAHDRDTMSGLYRLVPGRRPLASEIDVVAVEHAARFVAKINAPPRSLDRLAVGSEACFSLGEHLATVERRVGRLANIDRHAPLAGEAMAMVERRLEPIWRTVRAGIEQGARSAGVGLDSTVESVCISPSDFGFHNALVDAQGGYSFIDFEYAGCDDPAKLVCDFFCQPELPVALDHLDRFFEVIRVPLGLADDDLWRSRTLLPAYRIKWVCILLNEFLAVDAARRAFANEGERGTRARRQLDRASRQLGLVSAFL